MIVVTGAAGFIGSMMIWKLNSCDRKDVVAVDKFTSIHKRRNLEGLDIKHKIDRDQFLEWFDDHADSIDFVFHFGARTDTSETNFEILAELNTEYSMRVWNTCVRHNKPLVYASSAATYGDGAYGFVDNEALVPVLRPLNEYGRSKQKFDEWVLRQQVVPPFWAGLKFFNVYGPNEYHKGRMASVVFHAYNQVVRSKSIKLFRSHNSLFADGEQLRDFVYVKDVTEVAVFLMSVQDSPGIVNVGTSRPSTFLEVARNIFQVCNIPVSIDFIDIPLDIRQNYQYYTCADVSKLRRAGFHKPFHTIEEGITDYVVHHLMRETQIEMLDHQK